MCADSGGSYVIGVDAGGTNTRAALVDLDGNVTGHGTGPGANPNSGGDPVAALGMAVAAALGDVDPSRVVGGVFGIAGAGTAGRPKAVAAADAAWGAAGIPGRPDVVTDIAVAFAAGSTEPAGIVVFAGTGAGAAVVNDGAIERRADGYGWLVGDEGSAVWIGREAVRAALRAYDGRAMPTLLAESVPRALLGDAADALLADLGHALPGAGGASAGSLCPVPAGSALPQAVVKEVYAGPPAALGRLAPLVAAAAAKDDPVALRIVEEAASLLLADVDAVRPALTALTRRAGTAPLPPRTTTRGTPYGLVVAGALLEKGPVADEVRAGLRTRFGVDPVPARDGALGAARLAISRLDRQ